MSAVLRSTSVNRAWLSCGLTTTAAFRSRERVAASIPPSMSDTKNAAPKRDQKCRSTVLTVRRVLAHRRPVSRHAPSPRRTSPRSTRQRRGDQTASGRGAFHQTTSRRVQPGHRAVCTVRVRRRDAGGKAGQRGIDGRLERAGRSKCHGSTKIEDPVIAGRARSAPVLRSVSARAMHSPPYRPALGAPRIRTAPPQRTFQSKTGMRDRHDHAPALRHLD